MAFDVEAETPYVLSGTRATPDVVVQVAKDSLTAVSFGDVDRLNPPKDAVAPIRPFVSNHEATSHFATAFGDDIEAIGRLSEQAFDTGRDGAQIQYLLLGFHSHLTVELGE